MYDRWSRVILLSIPITYTNAHISYFNPHYQPHLSLEHVENQWLNHVAFVVQADLDKNTTYTKMTQSHDPLIMYRIYDVPKSLLLCVFSIHCQYPFCHLLIDMSICISSLLVWISLKYVYIKKLFVTTEPS